MAKVSKRYAEVSKLVDRNKTYPIEEAVALALQDGKQSSWILFADTDLRCEKHKSLRQA